MLVRRGFYVFTELYTTLDGEEYAYGTDSDGDGDFCCFRVGGDTWVGQLWEGNYFVVNLGDVGFSFPEGSLLAVKQVLTQGPPFVGDLSKTNFGCDLQGSVQLVEHPHPIYTLFRKAVCNA